MKVCVVGGGASLARPLLELWLGRNNEVWAVCPRTRPVVESPFLWVCGSVLEARAKLGEEPVDLLVTVCGSTADRKLDQMDGGEWDVVIGDTLKAPMRALSRIPVKDGSNVVVVGSVVGSTGAYGAANYAAAKAGLVGLVRSAALEWASRGVCVNLLELGFTDVGMGARLPEKVKARVLPTIPLGRFGTAEDFVHAVEFLSTTRYMTGGVLTLAGGLR